MPNITTNYAVTYTDYTIVRSERVRLEVEHENRKSIPPRAHVLLSISLTLRVALKALTAP